MAKIKKPTLRYFARFKEDFGYLRAVIRYRDTRKYVLTPIVITADQKARLDSSGHINCPQDNADHILEGRLQEYTRYIWQTVNPLLASGEFDDMPSTLLTTAIIDAKKADEAKRMEEIEKQTEESFQRRAEYAKQAGVTLNQVDIDTFAKLQKKLQKTLTPEEYAALWETPQWLKDYAAENYKKFMESRNQMNAKEGGSDEK